MITGIRLDGFGVVLDRFLKGLTGKRLVSESERVSKEIKSEDKYIIIHLVLVTEPRKAITHQSKRSPHKRIPKQSVLDNKGCNNLARFQQETFEKVVPRAYPRNP
jgi:hypothetical protein